MDSEMFVRCGRLGVRGGLDQCPSGGLGEQFHRCSVQPVERGKHVQAAVQRAESIGIGSAVAVTVRVLGL